MMPESEFHKHADQWLLKAQDAIDAADEEGEIDADYQSGILTLSMDSGDVYVLSKHAPSRQLWLSSPISGGLHFMYDAQNDNWQLADGRNLAELLAAELQTLCGVTVQF